MYRWKQLLNYYNGYYIIALQDHVVRTNYYWVKRVYWWSRCYKSRNTIPLVYSIYFKVALLKLVYSFFIRSTIMFQSNYLLGLLFVISVVRATPVTINSGKLFYQLRIFLDGTFYYFLDKFDGKKMIKIIYLIKNDYPELHENY